MYEIDLDTIAVAEEKQTVNDVVVILSFQSLHDCQILKKLSHERITVHLDRRLDAKLFLYHRNRFSEFSLLDLSMMNTMASGYK